MNNFFNNFQRIDETYLKNAVSKTTNSASVDDVSGEIFEVVFESYLIHINIDELAEIKLKQHLLKLEEAFESLEYFDIVSDMTVCAYVHEYPRYFSEVCLSDRIKIDIDLEKQSNKQISENVITSYKRYMNANFRGWDEADYSLPVSVSFICQVRYIEKPKTFDEFYSDMLKLATVMIPFERSLNYISDKSGLQYFQWKHEDGETIDNFATNSTMSMHQYGKRYYANFFKRFISDDFDSHQVSGTAQTSGHMFKIFKQLRTITKTEDQSQKFVFKYWGMYNQGAGNDKIVFSFLTCNDDKAPLSEYVEYMKSLLLNRITKTAKMEILEHNRELEIQFYISIHDKKPVNDIKARGYKYEFFENIGPNGKRINYVLRFVNDNFVSPSTPKRSGFNISQNATDAVRNNIQYHQDVRDGLYGKYDKTEEDD